MLDLSTFEARSALAQKYATKYTLEWTLVAAVVERESSWNPWAVRFEEEFEARYIKPAIPSMPTTTELTKAMSFGLMQIMAETAIEFGFTGKFLTELCDPDVGMDFGCRKLQKCLKEHRDTRSALLAYNGGSTQNYPDLVLANVVHYTPVSTSSTASTA